MAIPNTNMSNMILIVFIVLILFERDTPGGVMMDSEEEEYCGIKEVTVWEIRFIGRLRIGDKLIDSLSALG